MMSKLTKMTETKRMIVSKSSKKSVRSWPVLCENESVNDNHDVVGERKSTNIQPTTTSSGMTNAAIWIDEPTQIPIVSSILFFIAIQTEVTCSAAFATMGRRIRPMNAFGI